VALTFKEVRRVCQVPSSGKVRSSDYDPSWAANKDFKLPEHGRIGIFNRSYYEDVLVVRVHPELLGALPNRNHKDKLWQDRYDDINRFERHLTRNGTTILNGDNSSRLAGKSCWRTATAKRPGVRPRAKGGNR
jgi:hypothetical protein